MTDSLMADQGPPVDQPTAQSVLGVASRTLQFCSFEHHKGQVLLDEYTDHCVAVGAEKGWNRQCSIGYHSECSDRDGVNHNGDCDCPCHRYDKGALIAAILELEAVAVGAPLFRATRKEPTT